MRLPVPRPSASPRSLRNWLGQAQGSTLAGRRVRVDAGAATTEAEHTEVLNGSGCGGRGLQRLGGHAQAQRILRTRRECYGGQCGRT